MPLFDISQAAVRPFRRLSSSAEVYEAEIEQLFWDNLEAFAGEPLFPLARQPRVGSGMIPDLLALDPTGRVVVIEIKRDIDRTQLAQCLEYAGWARRTSLDELAGLYRLGTDRFFTDWQNFTGTTTPLLLNRVPRLVLVARSFDGRTDSALQYLQDSGVPVQLVRVVFYEDVTGNRIVDVDNGQEATPPSINSERPERLVGQRGVARGRMTSGVTLTDLIEAGVIEAGERIEWRRPQVGDVHSAAIDASGAVVVEDGDTYNSLSNAAVGVAGGSFNGWECWTVPRLRGVKIGELRGRAEVLGPSEG